jgi:hypothetical protein
VKAGISGAAPVGIGVALSNKDATAIVQGVYSGGPAGRSQGLAQAGQILASTGEAGAWGDFRDLDLQLIVSVILGKPGTDIQL